MRASGRTGMKAWERERLSRSRVAGVESGSNRLSSLIVNIDQKWLIFKLFKFFEGDFVLFIKHLDLK